jgi:hypothetical protein
VSQFAGTYTQYDTVGIQEDVSDAIYNISPKTTPLMSNAGKGEASQSLFEWQIDELEAPDTGNAQLEGDDIDEVDASVPTTRLGNYCQISRKTAAVSGSNQQAKKYGRSDELAFNMAKKSAELKRDVESILLENQAASAGVDDSAPRKTGSILAFIKTNVNKASNGANPIYTNIPTSVRTNGTQRTFTELLLQDVLLQGWDSGAEFSTLMVGGFNKQQVSGFDGIATKTIEQTAVKPAAIIGAADFYVGDFGGPISVVPNRFQRPRDAFLIDWNYIEVAYFRPFFTEPLSKTGDAEKRMLLGEYGLKVKNEQALGLVADLTVA